MSQGCLLKWCILVRYSKVLDQLQQMSCHICSLQMGLQIFYGLNPYLDTQSRVFIKFTADVIVMVITNMWYELLFLRSLTPFSKESRERNIPMMLAQMQSLWMRKINSPKWGRYLSMMIGTIDRKDEMKTKGVTAPMNGILPSPMVKAKEKHPMPPQNAISEDTKRMMTNRDASLVYFFDRYFPRLSMTYFEIPRVILMALVTTEIDCKGLRTLEPSRPLALVIISCVINCGMLSKNISLNFDRQANNMARSSVCSISRMVERAALSFSLNDMIRPAQ